MGDSSVVSIIIPCYNQGVFLQYALDSAILALKSANISGEIIIVNDGSNDNFTIKLLQNLNTDSRFKIMNQKNKGLSSARNTGLKAAHGQFIQFLDADDVLLSNKFKVQLEDFKTNPEIAISVSDFLFTNKNLKSKFRLETHKALFNEDSIARDLLLKWERGLTIPPHCFLFNHEVFYKNNELILFDESLHSREDWLMWCTLAFNGARFKFNPEILALYRMHNASMTKKVVRSLQGFMLAQTKIAYLIKEDNLRNKFMESSTEHMVNEYLFEYKNSIIPGQIIPVCYAKFLRMCKKVRKMLFV